MRLSRVIIRRFKSIDKLEIRLPEKDELRQGSADFVSIVGENNVGKSTIIEAIRLACPDGPKLTDDHFPNLKQAEGPIEVELEFDHLTDKDKEEHAIRAHFFEEGGLDKYHIKKVWRTTGAPEHWAYNPNKKQYKFKEGIAAATKRDLEQLGDEGKAILAAAEKESKSAAAEDPKKATKLNKESYLKAAVQIGSTLIEESGPWSPNPGGTLANLDTLLPKVIYVPALHETGAFADVAKKQSPIRKIVETLFERHLSQHEKVVLFRNAAAELTKLFDVEGKHSIVSDVESKITSKLRDLIDISADLRFEAPDVTSDLASQTELRILQGGVSTKPEHQGHGAQRTIVLALLQLFAEQLIDGIRTERARTLFLIEEPEIYMHPEMCRRMRDALLRIAQSGVAQVICTTHSPVFLDLADRHDGIVIVKRNGAAPVVKQRTEDVFKQTAEDKEQRDRLRMILNFDPVANEVFFSSSVCLVEGDCEIAAIDAIARKLHELKLLDWPSYLAARRSVAVVNCRGKWTILAFQRVLRAFDIKYRVIHDEDLTEGPRRANEQIERLLTAEDRRRVHKPHFEQHMFGVDWPGDKPWTATTTIRDAANVDPRLVEFLEFVLDRSLSQLQKPEAVTGSAKPLVQPVAQLSKVNFRARLKKLQVPGEVIQRALRMEQVFRVAAGPSFVPNVTEGAQMYRIDGALASVFVRVTGDSMADTLTGADVVAVEMLDNVYLHPVASSADKATKSSFCDRIEDNGIYVLAINDDIDQRAYTMKRVRVRELTNGGWICQIYADNREAAWGERGAKRIRKCDRVHFAAKVIGIVEGFDSSEGPERIVVPIADA